MLQHSMQRFITTNFSFFHKCTLWLLFLASAIFFSACGNNQQAQTSLQSNTFAVPSMSLHAEAIFQGRQQFFDDAYAKAKSRFMSDEIVRGTIIGANLSQKTQLASFFKSMEEHQHPRTVVILDAIALPATNKARVPSGKVLPLDKTPPPTHEAPLSTSAAPSIFIKTAPISTPYGVLFGDEDSAYRLLKAAPLMVTTEQLPRSSSANLLLPFLKKSFPQANYMVIFVDEKMASAQLSEFAELLKNNLSSQTLVIAQSMRNFTNNDAIDDFQYQFAKNVVENFDEQKIAELPFYQTAAVRTLLLYLQKIKAQKAVASLDPDIKPAFAENNLTPPENTPSLTAPSTTPNEKPAFIEYFLDGPRTQSRNIFIVSFGDIMLDRFVRTLMDKNGMAYPFQKMDTRYLQHNDLLIANLEGPIATKAAQTSKGIAFRFLPDVAPLLKQYFFDALSNANNHALDMGWEGFDETRQFIRDQSMMIFGNPKTINDQNLAFTTLQEQKVVFLGLDDVDFKIDEKAAADKVKTLTAQGYKVIPFLHWGVEYEHRPTSRQQQIGHQLIDAGAVAVIGCHPHVVQTYETYHQHPIFYSLGNAIFDQYFRSDTQQGLSIALIIANDQIQIYFIPIAIEKSQMRLMNDAERARFMQTMVTYGDYNGEEKAQLLKGYMSF